MTGDPSFCPSCDQPGASVGHITLKALLTPDGLRRGLPAQPRYCATPECPIVYFDGDGELTFTEIDLVVPVYAKNSTDADVSVCYCFGVNASAMCDPAKATELRGMVTQEVQAGHCACEVKNPKGACCLGDLIRIGRDSEKSAAKTDCCAVS